MKASKKPRGRAVRQGCVCRRRFRTPLLLYAEKCLRRRGLDHLVDPDDILQEVYLKAVGAGIFADVGSLAELYVWFSRCTYYTVSNWSRHLSVRQATSFCEAEPDDPDLIVSSSPSPEELAEARETGEIVFETLARLSISQARVFYLVVLKEHSVDETGEILGMTPHAVYKALERALREFRRTRRIIDKRF